MNCPRCGAYSPYNTAVCNRCGTKLAGKNAGKSPRTSRSRQYYSRTRQSDWEKKRDQFLAKINDSLDEIMADEKKRRLFWAAVITAAAVLIGSAAGCVSCSCSRNDQPAVSAGDAAEPGHGGSGGGLLGSLLGSAEETSGSDTEVPSGSDAGKEPAE